jgi:hypothetical protein
MFGLFLHLQFALFLMTVGLFIPTIQLQYNNCVNLSIPTKEESYWNINRFPPSSRMTSRNLVYIIRLSYYFFPFYDNDL